MPVDEVSLQIINMERAALDRWGRGDPDGFLEISAPDVAYFDPFLPERIDGLSALRSCAVRSSLTVTRSSIPR